MLLALGGIPDAKHVSMQLPSLRMLIGAPFVGMLYLPMDVTAAIPQEARKVIRQVHAAATDKDFSALRRLMVRDFQWSFGGDPDAEQALETWKADAKYLRNLKLVTAQPCGFIGREVVQCPAKAGTTFRAGFERTADGWRMRYFVEGD